MTGDEAAPDVFDVTWMGNVLEELVRTGHVDLVSALRELLDAERVAASYSNGEEIADGYRRVVTILLHELLIPCADDSGDAADSQPSIYPCGCSKHKVNLGRCDQYKPGELP